MIRVNNKEIVYINILKIIACFLVIVTHTGSLVCNYYKNFSITFFGIMYSISKIAVLIFLMITGVLCLDKEYSYKKIIKCIIRVFIPIFILSFICFVKDNSYGSVNFFTFLKSFLKGPLMFPYWYIYMLLGIYLVLPFLQKMLRRFNRRDYLIFITLFLIIPSFLSFVKLYTNISISTFFSRPFFGTVPAILICGNYLSKTSLTKNKLILSILFFLIFFVLYFFIIYNTFLSLGKIPGKLDDWGLFPLVIMAISFFYVIRYIFENRKINNKLEKNISIFASTTFGIFLIHNFLIYDLYGFTIFQTLFKYSSIIGTVVMYFSVFIISMVFVYFFKKIICFCLNSITNKV